MFGLLVILIGFGCVVFIVFPWTLLYSFAVDFSNVIQLACQYFLKLICDMFHLNSFTPSNPKISRCLNYLILSATPIIVFSLNAIMLDELGLCLHKHSFLNPSKLDQFNYFMASII
jgi:uncharacterized membrane protein YdcZ (DUF606 family)